MNVAILQPSYIPWRGYFHQIKKADIFVFYDCVQYDADGWRNRNQIKTPAGPLWLTIPVSAKGHTTGNLPIKDVAMDPVKPWRTKHWRSLAQNYAKAPNYSKYASLVEGFYNRSDRSLADFACDLTIAISRELGITDTQFVRSSELPAEGKKTDRLLSLLTHLGATRYISGPSARAYMEEDKLNAAGIAVEYMEYDYPEYPQLHGAYHPQLSILDALFNTGEDAARYIWGRCDPNGYSIQSLIPAGARAGVYIPNHHGRADCW